MNKPPIYTPSPSFSNIVETLATHGEATLLYDLEGVRTELQTLHQHLVGAFPDRASSILFSIKANRHPGLLRALARWGVGGEVASMPEVKLAVAAGLHRICATSPGLTAAQIASLVERGVDVNIDNPSQLAELSRGSDIGLRLRLAFERDTTLRGEGISRFGVDPDCAEMQAALSRGGHRVTAVHGHVRDIGSPERLQSLATTLREAARRHPDLRAVNFGGGMTRLYRDPAAAAEGWMRAGAVLEDLPAGIEILVEPGAQLVTAHGYLGTRVLSVLERPDGRRLVVLDASRWNLVTWSRIECVYPLGKPTHVADLVGPTCYENDVWDTGLTLPDLRPGDLIVFRGLGAYVASMSRRMHGLSGPREILL